MITDYEKSNLILEVAYKRLSSKEYSTLLNNPTNRQQAGQKLLDYLCDKYKIARIPLIVSNRPRKCTGKRQIYGFYQFCGKTGISITVYNKTAKTGQEVAIKTFVDTLLHEFIHHYDTAYLGISSTHTTGFYKRISDLKNKLEKCVN